MKYGFHRLVLHACLAVALLIPAACGRMSEGGVPAEDGSGLRVRMDLRIDAWDTATKAEDIGFSNGSRIYILLTSGERRKVVNAVTWGDHVWYIEPIYHNENHQIQSGGDLDLTGFSGGHCSCYYFESEWSYAGDWAGDETHFGINLGPRFAVYEDPDAVYGIADGEISFKIHLKPKNGRFRLAVRPGSDYGSGWPQLYGLSYYNYFDLGTFEIFTSTRRRGDNYYDASNSPYFYGFFPDPERKILTIGDWPYFERTFSEDILAPGSSSWMYMPTETEHNEWYRIPGEIFGDAFGVSDFRLRYIVPGSFRMGGDDARPIHTVTLTRGYYISETEITRNMWYQVMGAPADYANSTYPVTGKTWDEVQEFIAALNAKSGLAFRLPTEAEWEFAARGGLRSEGYRYSGSDTWSDVAVRDGNWSVQTVKSKNHNEWDLYDMSGNAAEWVADWYAAYPAEDAVDPTGPVSGDIHVRRGGNRGQEERYLTVSYRDIDSDLSMTGFRLALDARKIH